MVGCDARGGYTIPRVFTLCNYEDVNDFMMDLLTHDIHTFCECKRTDLCGVMIWDLIGIMKIPRN